MLQPVKHNFFHRRLVRMMVGVVIFGGIAVMNPGGFFSPIRQIAWYVLMPFVGATHSFGLYISDIRHTLSSIGDLKDENARLYEENQKCQSSAVSFQDIKKENEYLRSQFNLLPRDRYVFENAAVTGYGPNETDSWLMINKGIRDGIRDGMPVVVYGTILIGKVEDAQYASSRIRLLTNSESVVNVHTVESRSKGIAKGRFGIGMMLDMVLQADVIKNGDQVVTSELGSGYPEGLFVGEIQNIHPSENSLYQQATIISPVSFTDIRVVSIIQSEVSETEKE